MRTTKTTFLLLLMLLAFCPMQAQEIEMEFHYGNGLYHNMHNIVEAEDGTLLVQCPVFESFPYGSDLGCLFYKVSMEGELLDSLVVPTDTIPYRTLFEAVTVDSVERYLYAWFSKNHADSTTYLNMVFMDKDLNIVNTKEVAIVEMLKDVIITSSDMFIDPNNDIIATYLSNRCIHVHRIGLDGTMKGRNRLPEIETHSNLFLQARHSGVYSESPLSYYFMVTKNNSSNNYYINAYFIDSTLQDMGHHQYYKFMGNIYHCDGMQEDMVSMDDSTYLVFSRASGTQNYQFHNYSALVKYDRDHNVKGNCLFVEESSYSSIGPIRAAVAAPDTIYYAYMTDTGNSNQLVLACLDDDLNVRWVRYFLETGSFFWGTTMTVLSDGRIAIGAYRYGNSPNDIAVVVLKDELWNLDETSDIVRPYLFYPNPAQSRLHLQFSPDVKPTQVELYDLQGRLVRTQGDAFDSLDLGMLPAGTYTLRVTMEDGRVFSDKVVKE